MRRSGLASLALATLRGVGAAGAVGSAACFGDAPLPPPSSAEVVAPVVGESSEPFLATSAADGGVYLSWLERAEGGVHELRLARLDGSGWTEPLLIRRSERLFVSWADFPSVTAGPDGALWAHWLERSGDGAGSGYGVRIARSEDGGASWSEPWTPHQDATDAEHGFVAAIPLPNAVGFAWLDGRAFAAAGASAREETALYFRPVSEGGPTAPEAAIDARACDCCQTDAALTEAGPVLVYRDRSPDEIRDVHVTRWTDGAWSESRPVHEDGWETGACPVNGPAVDARGEEVAVAWFTAAGGVPRVKVAFSDDSAEDFRVPVVVDDGDPAGRVDVVMLDDGSALVSWLERTEGDWSDVRVRRVAPDGRTTPSHTVSSPSGERTSGFPRLARVSSDRVLVAWTDVGGAVSRVRLAEVSVPSTGDAR